jgi:hypothetical protein
MSLRENVEAILPEWERWYPSLFDAAADLGVIRPRVCAPSSLLLSRRHSAIRDEAIRAFRERWNALDEPDPRGGSKAPPLPARRAEVIKFPGAGQRPGGRR